MSSSKVTAHQDAHGRLELGPGNAVLLFFPLVLQNVMNMFAAVASYEYLIRLCNHFKPGELSLSLSPKHGRALNTRSNDFIHRYIERVTPRKQKNH